jgi:hypothetical protein
MTGFVTFDPGATPEAEFECHGIMSPQGVTLKARPWPFGCPHGAVLSATDRGRKSVRTVTGTCGVMLLLKVDIPADTLKCDWTWRQ